MATAKPQPQSKPEAKPRPGAKIQSIPRSRWQGPLAAGLCFGLGYGMTQRLLNLQLPTFVNLGQAFEIREFPGTGLQSLRLKFGSEAQQIRGRMELDQLAPQPPAPETSTDLDQAVLEGGESSSQNQPKFANLDGAGDQAPSAPQLPPPAAAPLPPAPAPQP